MVEKESRYGKKYQDDANDAKLRVIFNNQNGLEKLLFLHAKHTVYYLSIQVTMVTGTVIATTKFRNFLCACYKANPPNLQRKYDSCLQTFYVRHALSCSNLGLVIECHNEIHDNIIHLARQAFSPHCVRSKPLIHQGHIIIEGE